MLVRSLLVLGVVGVAGASVGAAPLNLTLLSHPDISASQIDVTYNASAGMLLLTATGFSINYEDDGLVATPAHQILNSGSPNFIDPIFMISMHVNNDGSIGAGSNTMSITGRIQDATLTIPFGTLIAGTITQFGFTTSGAGRLEFVFTPTSGALQAPYGLIGGIILDLHSQSGNPYPGSFAASWDNLNASHQVGTGAGVADTAGIVPAPGAGVLLALGVGLMGRRRR